jgi:S1-C subfamily serine protease
MENGRQVKSAQSTGSGVIITSDGYVLTNFHVAGHARETICYLSTGERVKATVVGADPWTDLAVLKIDQPDAKRKFPTISIAKSGKVEEGQEVMALGNPLGLNRTITVGVVSCANRAFQNEIARLPSGELTGKFNNWIQIDAAVNPGNSGGPLVNMRGELIGINTRANLQGNDIGFAVPVDIANGIAKQIIKYKKVQRGYAGIELQHLSSLGNFYPASQTGVLVREVDLSSPAERAGIKTGDVLLKVNKTKVNGRYVEDLAPVYQMIAELPVKTAAKFTILRDGKEQELEVPIEAMESGAEQVFEFAKWGLVVSDVSANAARRAGLPDSTGVAVKSVNASGLAGTAGLQQGDIIREFDKKPVKGLDEFKETCNKFNGAGKKVLLRLQRGTDVIFAVLVSEESAKPAAPQPKAEEKK